MKAIGLARRPSLCGLDETIGLLAAFTGMVFFHVPIEAGLMGQKLMKEDL
jgi:hypothetical protein